MPPFRYESRWPQLREHMLAAHEEALAMAANDWTQLARQRAEDLRIRDTGRLIAATGALHYPGTHTKLIEAENIVPECDPGPPEGTEKGDPALMVGSFVPWSAPNEFGTHASGEADAPGKRRWEGPGRAPRPYLRPTTRDVFTDEGVKVFGIYTRANLKTTWKAGPDQEQEAA